MNRPGKSPDMAGCADGKSEKISTTPFFPLRRICWTGLAALALSLSGCASAKAPMVTTPAASPPAKDMSNEIPTAPEVPVAKHAPLDDEAPPRCGNHVLLSTQALMATTPRANVDAEHLALRATDSLVAPQALYERFDADLRAIRNKTNDDGGARSIYPTFGAHGIILMVAPETIAALDQGIYTGFDCLNAWYGGKIVSVLKAVEMVIISFSALYHPRRIAEAYGQHPDVLGADANRVFGGGDNITLCNDTVGGAHRYLFTRGSGDCLAGCTHWAYRGYDVTEAGEVTRLSPSWQRDSMANEEKRPDWVLPGCFRRQ